MFTGSFNIVTLIIWVITAVVAASFSSRDEYWVPCVVVGVLLSFSPRMIKEWEKGILLRLGKFKKVLQPGVTWIVPGIDSITAKIDMRIRSTAFSAEKTLTKDTVPVNVDAVLFWIVVDAQKAILEVEDFMKTIAWTAQTTLRDVIGKAELSMMISEREAIDKKLQSIIESKTLEWGIKVLSVEIRDVKIPRGLEDAMSRKAQADREKEARIILAQSELKVAEQMEKASQIYKVNDTAMQLRAMNMTYESIKEKGALMVIPSGMNESMNFGSMAMAAASFRVQEKSIVHENDEEDTAEQKDDPKKKNAKEPKKEQDSKK